MTDMLLNRVNIVSSFPNLKTNALINIMSQPVVDTRRRYGLMDYSEVSDIGAIFWEILK